jgi:hypothetical protein
MINPFSISSMLNTPLLPELCQRIHAEALLRVARGGTENAVPSSVPVPQLRELIQSSGPETCLVHPTEIERLFQGMTFSLYQFIEVLYCSPLERSIQMVTRIVGALAQHANKPPIHEEAIWAICLYLDGQRERETRVTVKPGKAIWWLGEIAHTSATPEDDKAHSTLVAVLDISTPSVLAFRVGAGQSFTQLAALSLYDALMAARCPHPFPPGGLAWITPYRLLTPGALPAPCRLSCAELRVGIDECTTSSVPLLADLQTFWKDLHTPAPAALKVRLDLAFDTRLNRAYGNSPLRAREQADHRLRHLIGYQSDPARLVSALRTLLPSYDACISTAGEVFFDGLHYTDDLLILFPQAHVSLRRSEQTEAVIWVYLDAELLCEAQARELTRRDGSFRAHR